mgnify:CR=1 FL=1
MTQKRRKNSHSKKSNSLYFQKFERGLEKDVDRAEKWVIARKKFFIKLGWLVFLLTLLFIFSHLFLRMRGLGI